MDKATARRAIDLLMEASGQEQRCSVVFFGGEPLCNTPVIKDVVVYGRAESQRLGKTISFGMTTNGLLLSDSLIDFLTQNKVSILVSMDGPREVQDALRPAAGGKGSYDSLVPRVKALSRRRGGRISARATVSHQNVQVGRIVDHLASIGFGRVFCAPVSFACGNGALMLTEEDVDDITRDYEELALRLVDAVRERRPFPFGGFLRYIGRIHRAEKKLYGCGAGRNMIAVDPSGDVYPCHRFVGMEAFRMGSIFGQLDWDAVRRPFLEASVHALQRCSDCWARHLCGGYCLNEIARPDGSYDAPNPLNCRLVQREIELSLFVYAKIKELSPELLTRIGHRAPEAQGACNADPD
jgi:uncharacterized protein